MALATTAMTLRLLNASILVSTAAAVTTLVSAPAHAQYFSSSYRWQQPNPSGPVISPSQSGVRYRQIPPLMQQPSFSQPRRHSGPGGFGHSSGSYFGW